MRKSRLTACCAVAAVAAVAAVLAAAGCGSLKSGEASGANKTAAPAATAPSASSACPRGAWGYKIADAGAVAWRVDLPSGQVAAGNVQPVTAGGVAVFAAGHGLYAVRLSDGRQAWQRTFPQPEGTLDGSVYGLWTWHGSVIAQVGQVGGQGLVLSLDPADGTVNWTYRAGSPGLLGSQALTSDGVLAMLTTHGVLEGLDLADGKLLWSRRYGTSGGPVAAGPVVVATTGGTVTGFAARTGTVLWRRAGMSAQPTVLPVPGAGRVLVYDPDQHLSPQPPLFPVTALSAVTGRTLWRVTTQSPVGTVWAGAREVAITAWGSSGRLYLVDSATGAVRWSAVTHGTDFRSLAFTATGVVYVRSLPQTTAPPRTGQNAIVGRSMATGAVRWSTPVAGSPDGDLTAAPGPGLLLTEAPAASSDPSRLLAIDPATGRARVLAALPGVVQAPLTLSGNDVLIEPGYPACAVPAAAITGAPALARRPPPRPSAWTAAPG